jgi:hypothetical protein
VTRDIIIIIRIIIIIIVVNLGTSNICTMNSYITVFTKDMVCLRNISVDTLHKVDTEDDDNNNKF